MEPVLSQPTAVPPTRIPAPTVPATATVPAVAVWQSGDASTSHAPRAGEICWGAQIGKLERRDASYVVYYAQDTAEIVITNGACEVYGRSLTVIATQLQSEYPQVSWQVVADYASTPARPPTVVWQSGAQEQWYDPQVRESCWGTYVGRYRDVGTSYVVLFAQDSGPVAIFNGACERYGRSFADIVQVLQADYPAIRWVVVDAYQE